MVGGGLMVEGSVVVMAFSFSFAFVDLGARSKRGGGGRVDLFLVFLVKEYWREYLAVLSCMLVYWKREQAVKQLLE